MYACADKGQVELSLRMQCFGLLFKIRSSFLRLRDAGYVVTPIREPKESKRGYEGYDRYIIIWVCTLSYIPDAPIAEPKYIELRDNCLFCPIYNVLASVLGTRMIECLVFQMSSSILAEKVVKLCRVTRTYSLIQEYLLFSMTIFMTGETLFMTKLSNWYDL